MNNIDAKKNGISSNSQMHGKAFENILKSVFNASDVKRSASSKFDIEARFNKESNLPISIKVVNNNSKSISLADARRFFANDEDFIMLVGFYTQKENKKVWNILKEYKITKSILDELRGEISLSDVTEFHNKLIEFEYGDHIKARNFAEAKNKELKKKKSSIILNPKIDSKGQRRLQCSISVDELERVIGLNNIKTYIENYNFISLPIVIYSNERELKMKEKPEVQAAKSLDQFYTKPEFAKSCIQEVKSFLEKENLDIDVIVEPSAGDGAFISGVIEEMPNKKMVAFDIDPKQDYIQKEDFLEKDIGEFNGQKVLVLGNPPFGKNSSVAIKFFNKSAEFASVIAFIVPKTFKKSSVINKLDKSFHLEKEISVPDKSFLVLGEETDVPCVFQIWKKKGEFREKIINDTECEDYSFGNRDDSEWAFQRVGVNAGALKNKKVFLNIADASHIFMNFNRNEDSIVFSLIDWSAVKYNTAGNPSISRTEMKSEYLKTKVMCLGFLKDFTIDGEENEIISRGAIFRENGKVHVRIAENNIMKRLPVRLLFKENGKAAYSVNYDYRGHPFVVEDIIE